MENKQLPKFVLEAMQSTKETIDTIINNSYGINYYVLQKISINALTFVPNFENH